MKNKYGEMNIPFSEVYNEEDDVYYVSFKTGEPSYCIEVDDILIIEVGLFTDLPTGFRILNFNKNRFVDFKTLLSWIKKVKEALHETNPPKLGDRQIKVKQALEKILA